MRGKVLINRSEWNPETELCVWHTTNLIYGMVALQITSLGHVVNHMENENETGSLPHTTPKKPYVDLNVKYDR